MHALRIGLRRGGHLLHDAAIISRAQYNSRRTRHTATAGISLQLRSFVEELPEERRSVLDFVMGVASALPAGTRVLDAGAGDAPYRELFEHCEYVTADWENSPHPSGAKSDIVGSLEALPVDDGSFDAVLSTQVLEHVAEPLRVLRELHRVVRSGGRLYLTAPLIGELHEEPYDFFRYTPYGLRHLLCNAGFQVDSINPRNGYFATLGNLARTGTWAIGDANDGRAGERATTRRLLLWLASFVAAFDDLDVRRILPLGYECVATHPTA